MLRQRLPPLHPAFHFKDGALKSLWTDYSLDSLYQKPYNTSKSESPTKN
jgi:hypothetical protein